MVHERIVFSISLPRSLINTAVIPFKATAYQIGKFVPVSSDSIKGKWSVFVCFPAVFTFVCPTELGDLADNCAEFQSMGVDIYGISTDTLFTHKALHDSSPEMGKVNYALIGDPGHQLAKELMRRVKAAQYIAAGNGAKTALGAFDHLMRTSAKA